MDSFQDKFANDLYENFYTKKKDKDFYEILSIVQEDLLKRNETLLFEEKVREKEIKPFIKQILRKKQLTESKMTEEELVDRLFKEIAEFSFLTNYFNKKDIEEININSFENINIVKENGNIISSDEIFNSQAHAVDVIRRLLHKSKMILDASSPLVRGHLSKRIRITCFHPPAIDEDIGISASIRLINPKNLAENDFIKNKTANKEMLAFLSDILNSGISICSAGATGSGKTTMMSYLLSKVPNEKRVITIENEVREFNLIKKNKNGKTLNNIIHLVTKESEEEKRSITQEKLLEYSLTANPDIICIAEAKSSEAFMAQEAARTGHAVITTVHANSCMETYYRLLTLCRLKYDLGEDLLFKLITEAFPIVFYMKKLPDNSRKIMEISEYVYGEGKGENGNEKGELRTIFKYDYSENSFVKTGKVSKTLKNKILENGMRKEDIIWD